jgi:stringent starvation protein B
MSSPPIAPATAGSSTRPYLIRALHDWCTDNGFTPYVAVFVDAQVQVPVEYVKNNEIVLNVGFEATSALKLGNETIEFKARFGGSSREIVVRERTGRAWHSRCPATASRPRSRLAMSRRRPPWCRHAGRGSR